MVEAIGAAALAAWAYLLLLRGGFWRTGFPLAPAPEPSEPARLRSVAVVMPARDEAATVARAVESLTHQKWGGPLHIWVVDDDSSDGTGRIARKAGGSRVSVVPAGALPTGWSGKVWAMSRGVEQALAARPDYILLTDADIVHDPLSVHDLVARVDAGGLGMASVMVRLHCQSIAERLLTPAFVFFFFMLYPPRWIASRRCRTAGAAGGCILITPAALKRIGGLASVRGELIDDCALAKRVKSSGGAIWLGMTGATRSVREYPTFCDIRRMISRTAFTQLRHSLPLLVGTVVGMAFLYGAPVAAALLGSYAGALAWALSTLAYLPMLGFYRRSRLYVLLLPFVAAFYVAATIESALAYWSGRGGAWKGRNQAASIT